jgi:hypothetical protein
MLIPRFRFNLKNIANYETSRLVAGELEKQIAGHFLLAGTISMIEAVMIWNEPNNKSHWDFEIDPYWRLFVLFGSAKIASESGRPTFVAATSNAAVNSMSLI